MMAPVRRAITIWTILAFVPAFVRAPLDHVHSHGPQDHPHSGFFHSHIAQANNGAGPELRDYDPDEDARSLDWFQPVASPIATFIAVLLPFADFVPPSVKVEHIELTEFCGHDPPAAGPSSPRAPPV
jgi:hypothetical protein